MKTVAYFDIETLMNPQGIEMYRTYQKVYNTNPVVVCVRGKSDKKLSWVENALGKDVSVMQLKHKRDVLKLKEEYCVTGKMAMLIDVDLDIVNEWGPTALYMKT